MLLDKRGKLEELIVELLGLMPNVTAREIGTQLARRGCSCTKQAVYQELRKLQKSNIVVKMRDCFSLRVEWVLDMLELTQLMADKLLRKLPREQFLPPKGKQIRWKFHSLQSLVQFYTHLGLVLIEQSNSKVCYEYGPHVWYHLAAFENEKRFLKALTSWKLRYYLVVGADTLLDRSYGKEFPGKAGEISFGHMPFGKKASYFIVVDDYIVSLHLSSLLIRALDALYESAVPTFSHVREIQKVFQEKHAIKLTISNEPIEAAKRVRNFKRFFGLRSADSSG